MAISDINTYAHLTDADVEALGHELDAIRREIEADRGLRDVRYLHRTIKLQRASSNSPGGSCCSAATADRFVAAGDHRARAGQDHREHGTRAQRDARAMGLDERPRGPFDHLRVGYGVRVTALEAFHNYIHHKYTNVLGMDDVGYKVLRVTATNRGHRGGYFSRSPTSCSPPPSNGVSACTISASVRSSR